MHKSRHASDNPADALKSSSCRAAAHRPVAMGNEFTAFSGLLAAYYVDHRLSTSALLTKAPQFLGESSAWYDK
eukprot:scaffold6225_cov26-Prasinocladus_malaysianus.AAC.2